MERVCHVATTRAGRHRGSRSTAAARRGAGQGLAAGAGRGRPARGGGRDHGRRCRPRRPADLRRRGARDLRRGAICVGSSREECSSRSCLAPASSPGVRSAEATPTRSTRSGASSGARSATSSCGPTGAARRAGERLSLVAELVRAAAAPARRGRAPPATEGGACRRSGWREPRSGSPILPAPASDPPERHGEGNSAPGHEVTAVPGVGAGGTAVGGVEGAGETGTGPAARRAEPSARAVDGCAGRRRRHAVDRRAPGRDRPGGARRVAAVVAARRAGRGRADDRGRAAPRGGRDVRPLRPGGADGPAPPRRARMRDREPGVDHRPRHRTGGRPGARLADRHRRARGGILARSAADRERRARGAR